MISTERFFDAVTQNDTLLVKLMVGNGAVVNSDDNLALKMAIANENEIIVKLLIEAKVEFDESENDILERAIIAGNINIFSYLLQNTDLYPTMETVLTSCWQGNFEIIRALVHHAKLSDRYRYSCFQFLKNKKRDFSAAMRLLVDMECKEEICVLLRANASEDALLGVLKYLIKNCKFWLLDDILKTDVDVHAHNHKFLKDAIREGDEDILRYLFTRFRLRQNGISIDQALLYAKKRNFEKGAEAIDSLRKIPPKSILLWYVAVSDHVDMLKRIMQCSEN